MSIDLQPEIESVKSWLLLRAKDAGRESVEDYLGHMKFEQVYEMMVRYARQRKLGLVGPPPEPKPESGWEKIFESFHSEACPGCGKHKKKESYFCINCWHKIPEMDRNNFRHGLRISVVSPWFSVVKGLRKG